jgi:cholesterol transport system auxiliary component
MRIPMPLTACALALLALGSLSGCATVSALGTASEVLDVYELRAPGGLPEGPTRAREVVIEEPTTSGALQTDRIMIRPNPLQAQYLPGVRWGDTTPVMVQTLILRTLEGTGRLRYVGRRPLGISGDFAVLTEIVDFQAEAAAEGPGAVVALTLSARVVREADTRIMGTRRFAVRVPVASVDEADVIAGFDRAAQQLLAEHGAWVLSVVR